MGNWTFVWFIVILIYQTLAAIDRAFPTNRNGDRFTSMIVKHESSTIYLAENGFIHRLDMDFKLEESISTCDIKDCENINKVMTMDNNFLIVCGTGKNLSCQAINDGTVKYFSSGDISDENYLAVSADVNRPAVGLGLNGHFFLGVTNGTGLRTTNENTYEYLISRTNIKDSFSPLGTVKLQGSNIIDDYIVYFRKIFYHKGFVYFLTNQRYDLSVDDYTSKLIRICVNETYLQESFQMKWYTDIELTCDIDGGKYNLLQDAEFLPAKGILVAFFSRGDNPENPTSESAVCVYTLDAVNDTIVQAKKDFITCPPKNKTFYLETLLNNCVPEKEYDILEQDYFCPLSPHKGIRVIGDKSLQPTSTYKLQGGDSKITKVKGIDRYELYPDVYFGTDNGHINKVSLDEDLNIFVYENNIAVDRGHSVRDIHVGDNVFFVLSDRKLFRYQDRSCSTKFTTCQETMEGKNPSCGWCLIEHGSTRLTDCSEPSTWLSSLSKCVSATVWPKYLPVNTNSKFLLQPSDNFPSGLPVKCRYFRGKGNVGPFYNANILGNGSIECEAPTFDVIGELTVTLASDSTRQILLEANVLVYKCDMFLNCSSCLVSPSVSCNWCPDELKCKETCNGVSIKKGQNTMCPKMLRTDIYVPSGRSTTISIEGQNLVSTVEYECMVNESDLSISHAVLNADNRTLTCSINVSIEDSAERKEIPIAVLQTKGIEKVRLEDANGSSITVYRCEELGRDCTMCNALKTDIYECNWCVENYCGPKLKCQASENCPLPNITEVRPANAGYKGLPPEIIITATNLGTINDTITQVKVGSLDCNVSNITRLSEGFEIQINKEIFCSMKSKGNDPLLDMLLNVTFLFNSVRVGTGHFAFRNPVVTSIVPNFSPQVGGTLVTLIGNNLRIGKNLERVLFGSVPCENSKYNNSVITCTTASLSPRDSSLPTDEIKVTIDMETYISNVTFYFLLSPVIDKHFTEKSVVSGGTNFIASGKNLRNAATVTITTQYAGETSVGNCKANETAVSCKSPVAPQPVKDEMEENMGDGSDESTNKASIDVQVTIKMDGYEKTFTLRYFRDPVFDTFSDLDETRVFKSSPSDLIITGKYINLAAGKGDYRVSIGSTGNCDVTHITESNITCRPPAYSPSGNADKLAVVVNLGFFKNPVGYVKYDFESTEEAVGKILKIVIPIVCGIILIGVLFAIFGGVKYRRVKTKAKKFEDNLADMEMKIKKVFREEFLDMHTTMSRVNESLIEKGFPYNSYQRYSFLLMFPGEWHMEEHPLMHEPVVSNRQVSDAVRVRLKKGMETFEELLLNKFFLLSVISTMEKQKKFFLKEKSNMAGYLSVGLLGKMEYFHEILTVLLTNLVSDTPTKSQKTLFRRCESITEKLLSNWLVLSLYPHVKMHSGSPLYMLLKGTQLTMESGPIDAITGDSKYTLSEEKLLKQDDKPNTLTLKIMVDNSDEIRDCKVLDCDTISQVKAKCLSQIYVNYPASQLTVDSSELNLEWHWGIGGRIVIKDEDTSSKREGEWLQLNTLEHYRVQDESSLALVDPHGVIEQEDYVNLAQIKIDPDPGCNSSIHSNEPLAPHDEEDGGLITRWHLVKPETDQHKPGSVVIDELYLNRLITTKQSVLEFMRNLFDTILNNTVPPPAKFLFDLLDELGDQNKVDPDSVHAWKSQCYLIRFWATLINKPYNLFDQRIPSYVETSMEVISQVLIESCSLKAHQYTKDSSPGKLIFKNDMVSYRDKVKDYYTRVKDHQQTEEDLRQYLTDLNRFQHQQMSFNKHAALYTLYMQLQPYIEEIMEDLESNSETKSLHLDRKLANLINKMQED